MLTCSRWLNKYPGKTLSLLFLTLVANVTRAQGLPVIFHVSRNLSKLTRDSTGHRVNLGTAHSYQYTFAPNPHWSSLYAPGPEIQKYLQGVAEKFGATRFIKTQHQVVRCVWNAETKKWLVRVQKTGSGDVFEEEVDVVLAARGQLNDVSWPEVPGLDKYRGKLLHSAEWDEG